VLQKKILEGKTLNPNMQISLKVSFASPESIWDSFSGPPKAPAEKEGHPGVGYPQGVFGF
jgi:hypothetical protein